MPLQDLFEEQIDQLRAFMEFPGLALLDLRHGAELKRMLIRILLGLQDEEDNPHLMAFSEIDFLNPQQFFADLQTELFESNEQTRAALMEERIDLPNPVQDARLHSIYTFADYVSVVADSFPDSVGSYVIILNPQRVEDAPMFADSMRELAGLIRSDWAKFIFLDDREKPLLPDIEQQSKRAIVQDFHFAPEKIEAQVNADIARGRLKPPELRQYLAMAGAFAFSRGELDRAIQIQNQTVQLAEKEGAPSDRASALYNLGNTHFKKEQFTEAESCFVRAAQICLEHKLNPLLAMVMSNLGLTLHRLQHPEESLQSLEVARRTFAAMNNPPGEAFVLDCKAAVLASEQRHREAEEAWLKALAIYDGITNPALVEIKSSGRGDILNKLESFYKANRQPNKIKNLHAGQPLAS